LATLVPAAEVQFRLGNHLLDFGSPTLAAAMSSHIGNLPRQILLYGDFVRMVFAPQT
jgi:hypothetical protein